jgi:hypothetical protein
MPAPEAKSTNEDGGVVLVRLCAAIGLRGDARHDRVPDSNSLRAETADAVLRAAALPSVRGVVA